MISKNRKSIALVLLMVAFTACQRSKPMSEAERFDRIARKVFKEVYPGLARQILDDYGITKGTCLDLGCGPAYWSIELAKRCNLQIIGVDIDSEAVRIAQRNVKRAGLSDRISIETGDVHHLRFADGEADLIISRGSFLFWTDRVQAFKEIYRVLKLNGVAFIGGGMGKAVSPEKKEIIKKQLEKSGCIRSCKSTVTKYEMEEILGMAGVINYRIMGDGPTDSGCKCGMWVEIKKPPTDVNSAEKP